MQGRGPRHPRAGNAGPRRIRARSAGPGRRGAGPRVPKIRARAARAPRSEHVGHPPTAEGVIGPRVFGSSRREASGAAAILPGRMSAPSALRGPDRSTARGGPRRIESEDPGGERHPLEHRPPDDSRTRRPISLDRPPHLLLPRVRIARTANGSERSGGRDERGAPSPPHRHRHEGEAGLAPAAPQGTPEWSAASPRGSISTERSRAQDHVASTAAAALCVTATRGHPPNQHHTTPRACRHARKCGGPPCMRYRLQYEADPGRAERGRSPQGRTRPTQPRLPRHCRARGGSGAHRAERAGGPAARPSTCSGRAGSLSRQGRANRSGPARPGALRRAAPANMRSRSSLPARRLRRPVGLAIPRDRQSSHQSGLLSRRVSGRAPDQVRRLRPGLVRRRNGAAG